MSKSFWSTCLIVLLYAINVRGGVGFQYVELEDTIKGFRDLAEGKYDHLPESAFYMVGGIEEAVEKAKTLS